MVKKGKRLLLLVNDNEAIMDVYKRMLRGNGFDIHFCSSPDAALRFSRKKRGDISIIIMEIILPPGRAYAAEDTRQGIRTGLFLYPDLRELCPDVPIIVLTRTVNPETLGYFKEGPVLRVLNKSKCPPKELVETAEAMLRNKGG